MRHTTNANKRTRSEDANAEAIEEQCVAQLDARPQLKNRLASFCGDVNARAVQNDFDDECAAFGSTIVLACFGLGGGHRLRFGRFPLLSFL